MPLQCFNVSFHTARHICMICSIPAEENSISVKYNDRVRVDFNSG